MVKKDNITILITTFDRYDSTLPICLLSLANQSRLPDRVILVDDNKNKEFYDKQVLRNIISYFKTKNIVFDYYHGKSKGATHALELGLGKIDDGWVLKMDDDNCLEYDVLELFEKNISERVGAMGGIILDNSVRDDIDDKFLPKQTGGYYNLIENIFFEFNIQLIKQQSKEIKKVHHIYSNYFFKRSLVDSYPLELSPSCHREDTIVTHEIYRKGYDLIVIPQVKIYHLNSHKKSGDGRWDYLINNNEYVFIERLKSWGVIPKFLKIIEKKGKLYAMRNEESFLVVR